MSYCVHPAAYQHRHRPRRLTHRQMIAIRQRLGLDGKFDHARYRELLRSAAYQRRCDFVP